MELYELWQIVNKLPYKVTFMRGSKADVYMKKVHKYARLGLNEYDIDYEYYYFRKSKVDSFEYTKDFHKRFYVEKPKPLFGLIPPIQDKVLSKDNNKCIESFLNNDYKEPKRLSIIAKEHDVLVSQVRYYVNNGLLFPVKTQGGFLLFSEKEEERLERIFELKKQGHTLDEISKIINEE